MCACKYASMHGVCRKSLNRLSGVCLKCAWSVPAKCAEIVPKELKPTNRDVPKVCLTCFGLPESVPEKCACVCAHVYKIHSHALLCVPAAWLCLSNCKDAVAPSRSCSLSLSIYLSLSLSLSFALVIALMLWPNGP